MRRGALSWRTPVSCSTEIRLPAPYTANVPAPSCNKAASAARDNSAPTVYASAANICASATVNAYAAAAIVSVSIIARGAKVDSSAITGTACIEAASPGVNGTAAIDPSAACDKAAAAVRATASKGDSPSPAAKSSIGAEGTRFRYAGNRGCRR